MPTTKETKPVKAKGKAAAKADAKTKKAVAKATKRKCLGGRESLNLPPLEAFCKLLTGCCDVTGAPLHTDSGEGTLTDTLRRALSVSGIRRQIYGLGALCCPRGSRNRPCF